MTAVARTTAFQVKRISTPARSRSAAERSGPAQGLEEEQAHGRRRKHERQRQDRLEQRAPAPRRRDRCQAAKIPNGRIRSVAIAATRSVSRRIERSSGVTATSRRGRGSRAS